MSELHRKDQPLFSLPWNQKNDEPDDEEPKEYLQHNLRERPLTPASLWREYLKKGWKSTIWFVICLTYSAGTFASLVVTDNPGAAARQQLVAQSQMLNVAADKRQAARMELGKSLLTVSINGLPTAMDAARGKDNKYQRDVIAQVKKLATTGKPIQLDTQKTTLTGTPVKYLTPFAITMMIVMSFIMSVKYCRQTYLRREYFADLPWKRAWPLVFVALLPLLIPVMVISAIQKYQRRNRLEEAEVEETYAFESNVDGARIAYFTLRAGKWASYIKDRKQAIRDRLAEIPPTVRALQTERGELQAEARELDQTDVTSAAPNANVIQAEFDAIINAPSVYGINADATHVYVLVKARYDLNGVRYDLGDWEIEVSTAGLTAFELRTGTKVKWQLMAHPIYRLRENVFCFGFRIATINAFLREGKISEAILQAVAGLNGINEVDIPLVPSAFKVATD